MIKSAVEVHMKIFSLFVSLLCFSIVLTSCQHREKAETTFYRDFEVARSVESLSFPRLRGTSSGASSQSLIGETTKRQRTGELDFTLDGSDAKPFDNVLFLDGLRAEIRSQMETFDIEVKGLSSGNERFSFEYVQTSKNEGFIEVIGTVLPSNRYKLWYTIRETSRDDVCD